MNNFLGDDLRETHRADTITRVIDRHPTVEPSAYMLNTTLQFKPKSQADSLDQRTG